jgi:hypothetical protein
LKTPDFAAGRKFLLPHLSEMFAGQNQHPVSAPLCKGSMTGVVELRLFEHFRPQLLGDDV